ncbi:hypothetical protein HYU23_00030 [Candidatus Woesearchaeota archaeon]|nr:hypothetical protein [Candidatus Woesearchaeota archaeon]
MEKGLFVGIIVGLILVFSLFTIGFYFGSAATGYFTLNFFKTNTNLIDQSTEQVSEPVREQTTQISDVSTIVKDTSMMVSDGNRFNPCNTFNPVANFTNYSSGYEFCTKFGYNSCYEIRSPLLKDPSSCNTGIGCAEEPAYEYVNKIVNITETVPINKTIDVFNKFEGQVKLLRGVSNIIKSPDGEVLNITFKEFDYLSDYRWADPIAFCKNGGFNNQSNRDLLILKQFFTCINSKPYNATTGDEFNVTFYPNGSIKSYPYIPYIVKIDKFWGGIVEYNKNHPFWSDTDKYLPNPQISWDGRVNYYYEYLNKFTVFVVSYEDTINDFTDNIVINYSHHYFTKKNIIELVNLSKQFEITEKVQKGFEKKCYSTLDNVSPIYITCCNVPRDQIPVEPNVPAQQPYEYSKPVAQPVQQKSSEQTSQSQEQTSFFGKFANFFSF